MRTLTTPFPLTKRLDNIEMATTTTISKLDNIQIMTTTISRTRSSGSSSRYYTTILGRYMLTVGVFWLSLVAVMATYFTMGPSSTIATTLSTLETMNDTLILDTETIQSLLEEDDEEDRILQATKAMRQEIRALNRWTNSKYRHKRP